MNKKYLRNSKRNNIRTLHSEITTLKVFTVVCANGY